MKKIFFIIFSVLLTNPLSSQVIFNHKIDSVLNLVSVHSVSRINKELSGDTVVTIGGVPQILYSRYWPTTGNVKASQYIYEKLQNYGYNAKYQLNNSTCVNVYTEKTGSKFPGRKYIISAHYDDITNPFPSLYDTIHGSDDNASGVCCVLEAARLLANYNCDYTIVFALFDEEEILTYLGSKAFADSAYFRGDTILGVINMDMVAYNINNDSLLFLYTNINSMNLTDDLANCLQIYNLNLNIFKYITESQGSDQINFWARNYKAISGQEYHFNPNYHKKEEKFNNINLPYFIRCVKASLAVLLTWATDYHIVFAHNRILSSLDTSARIATAIIKIPSVLGTIGTSGNAPRLYYKTDNGQFNYVNAFYINGDQFNFIIPGNTAGKKISYYLALQDSAASFVFTLPGGGSGVNPPGTISPPSIYTYDILSAGNFCSNNLRPINDFQTTTDTIWIQQQGLIADVNVNLNINHTRDGDIFIWLESPAGTTNLSQYIGANGQNYTNTTFNDSAAIPISQGTPPFTGSFKPQLVLSAFNNKQMSGPWVLSIYDNGAGNQGNLLNWCLNIKYSSAIAIKENNQVVNEYKLFQNYPNPFNPSTIIRFKIKDSRFVTLKIYNILGKEIATLVNEKLKEGEYGVTFDGSALPSGIYFYRLKSENFSETKKLMLLK